MIIIVFLISFSLTPKKMENQVRSELRAFYESAEPETKLELAISLLGVLRREMKNPNPDKLMGLMHITLNIDKILSSISSLDLDARAYQRLEMTAAENFSFNIEIVKLLDQLGDGYKSELRKLQAA